MHASSSYNLAFAAAVCVVCAVVVSTSFVALEDLQLKNQALEKRRNVLIAAGLTTGDTRLSTSDVDLLFNTIEQVVVDLETGEEVAEIDPNLFDQRSAATRVETSRLAADNNARVKRVPKNALVYELRDADDELELVILPISGMGLWSTLYGFVAFDADLTTIRGLTFYEHGETPGLGGEVDNSRWKQLWLGRKAFDGEKNIRIEVIKGIAGEPDEDPFRVDGLAGATMTSRGVTNMLHFWLSEEGFQPYLNRLRNDGVL